MTSGRPRDDRRDVDALPGDEIPNAAPTFEVGRSGLKRVGGYVQEEFLPQLSGRKAVQIYREMADNSPVIGAFLLAIERLIRQIEWRVEPASQSAEDKANAEFVEQAMADMEHCYDDQTEILTRRGWVRFADLSDGDEVAQRSADGDLEYVLPVERQAYDYAGELMGSSGDAVDFRVTPNHRMLFAPRRGRAYDVAQKLNLQMYKCEDIYGKTGWLSKEVRWGGVPTGHSENWLEFLGFTLADGSVAGGRSIVLIQKEQAYVEDLLLRCGLSEQVTRREVNGSTQWTLHRAALARELASDFGRVSREKHLPRWLIEASPGEQRAFLRGFIEGDGWRALSGLVALFTSSKQLSDDLQILAMKAGYAATVLTLVGPKNSHAPGLPKYRVSLWAREEHLRPQLKAGRSWLKEAYAGKVYCVTVPSGVVMVRRNGKAMWCGNSWDDMLTEIMSMCTYGWEWSFVTYKRRIGPWEASPERRSKHTDGRYGWRKIEIRSQESLLRWNFAPNGDVEAMVQMPAPDYQKYVLDAKRSLLFRVTRAKNNPEGRSLLRNSYASWFYLKRFQEIEAVGVERDLTGVPIAKVPARLFTALPGSKEAKEFDAWKQMVTAVRRNEQEGLVIPQDIDPDTKQPSHDFALLTSGGTRQFDIRAIINDYKTEMLMSVLADFMMVGHEDNGGSYALHTDKTGMFRASLNAIAKSIADVFNRDAIPRLFAINAMRPAELPTIVPNDVDPPDLTQLGAFMTAMTSAGIQWFPDPELEKFLRDAARLPQLDDSVEKVREVQQRQAAIIALAQQKLEGIQIEQQAAQGEMAMEQMAQGVDPNAPAGPGAPDPSQVNPKAGKQQADQGDVATQRAKIGLDTDKTKLSQEREKLSQLKKPQPKPAAKKTPVKKSLVGNPFGVEHGKATV